MERESKPYNSRHEPTEQTRGQVRKLVIAGIPHVVIADVLGVAKKTLQKYYDEELKFGRVQADSNMAAALYQSGIRGNVAAQIFWCKTRLGWKERDALELSGPDGGAIQLQAVDRPAPVDRDKWLQNVKKEIKVIEGGKK